MDLTASTIWTNREGSAQQQLLPWNKVATPLEGSYTVGLVSPPSPKDRALAVLFPFPQSSTGVMDVVVLVDDRPMMSAKMTKDQILETYPPSSTLIINSSESVCALLNTYKVAHIPGPVVATVHQVEDYLSVWIKSATKLPELSPSPTPSLINVLIKDKGKMFVVTPDGFRSEFSSIHLPRYSPSAMFIVDKVPPFIPESSIARTTNPLMWAMMLSSPAHLGWLSTDIVEEPIVSRVTAKDAIALIALGQELGEDVSHAAIAQLIHIGFDGYLIDVPKVIPQEFSLEGGPLTRSIVRSVNLHPSRQPSVTMVIENIFQATRTRISSETLSLLVGEMPGYRVFRDRVEVFLY